MARSCSTFAVSMTRLILPPISPASILHSAEATAMKWLDRLFRHSPSNEPGASASSAGMVSALAAAQAGDYQLALDLWAPLARAGNARAQNNIGACFAEGLGVER